jgi:anti-sigma-K factor RskA
MTDELKENAALFALGLLEAAEAEAFLQEAARDPELAALAADYEATLGVIALSADPIEPPASLRASILAKAMEGDVPAVLPAPVVLPSIQNAKPARRFQAVVPWSLAACLAIGCAVLAYRTATLQREKAALLASRDDWSSLRLAVLAPAEPGSSDATGRALWDEERGVGVFESGTLPALAANQVYQLWIFEKDNPAPVPSGFFLPAEGTRAELKPQRPVGEVAAVAVSIEVAGGRPQPEGPVVLVGKVETSG